jgi:protein-L-isoaspartate(D-aspartate) O-methyltransferase
MIDALKTRPDQTVLDVGTGSAYQAAILSKLVRRVVSVERVPELLESASKVLTELGFTNVEVHLAGDELGWPGDAPYDGIIVGAAAPRVPSALVEQLKIGCRLVIPVGGPETQNITVVERTKTGHHQSVMEAVKFVPLVGKGAWPGQES